MQGELKEHREEYVEVEDIAQRSLLREFLNRLIHVQLASESNKKKQMPYLGTGNTKEAHRHEHSANRHLIVAIFDAVQVLHAQAPCSDKAVERKNLIHLDSCNKSAATLANNSSN
jgi:hypothetical protein